MLHIGFSCGMICFMNMKLEMTSQRIAGDERFANHDVTVEVGEYSNVMITWYDGEPQGLMFDLDRFLKVAEMLKEWRHD